MRRSVHRQRVQIEFGQRRLDLFQRHLDKRLQRIHTIQYHLEIRVDRRVGTGSESDQAFVKYLQIVVDANETMKSSTIAVHIVLMGIKRSIQCFQMIDLTADLEQLVIRLRTRDYDMSVAATHYLVFPMASFLCSRGASLSDASKAMFDDHPFVGMIIQTVSQTVDRV
jgi:hypothetical protein